MLLYQVPGSKTNYNPKEKLYLFRQDYLASDGKEIFLSFENKNRRLYSLLRLRITSQNRGFIRELHTYGQLHPIDTGSTIISPQHKGLGRKLVKEAEIISKKEFSIDNLAVIAAVGTRDYFRKLEYRLEKTYMVKKFKSKKPITENKATAGKAGIGRRVC